MTCRSYRTGLHFRWKANRDKEAARLAQEREELQSAFKREKAAAKDARSCESKALIELNDIRDRGEAMAETIRKYEEQIAGLKHSLSIATSQAQTRATLIAGLEVELKTERKQHADMRQNLAEEKFEVRSMGIQMSQMNQEMAAVYDHTEAMNQSNSELVARCNALHSQLELVIEVMNRGQRVNSQMVRGELVNRIPRLFVLYRLCSRN
jgi:chromosome segregation ATPase